MPIEIRELIIKATVKDNESTEESTSESQEVNKESIISECVDQILEILQKKNER